MTKSLKISFHACLALGVLALSHSASASTIDQRIIARLNALEQENAALRARVNRLETSRATRLEQRPTIAPISLPDRAMTRDDGRVLMPRRSYSPSFEISGSLLYLQPGAGNLEYGTLTTPLPAVSPSWQNQSLTPKLSAAFNIGVRYIANESVDFALSWTHLDSSANASFFATPTQMVGPPFLIGPESALYKRGSGAVNFAYDSGKLDVGYTFCAECSFQLRAFGGVEYARMARV